jgi:nitroreductase
VCKATVNQKKEKAMDFEELIEKRYSVRAYEKRPVEDEKLQLVLNAARMAPTGSNRQAFQLLVIHTTGREDEMRRIYNKDWFVDAPIVIVACGAPGYQLDIGIVMDHLILAATALGLGTCWIGSLNRDAVREILGVPEDIEPIICTTLGYGAGETRPKKRKPLEELVRYEHW